MLSLLTLLYLQVHEPTCIELKPAINLIVLEKIKYEGKGIPEVVYCKAEGK